MRHDAINLAQGFPDFACPQELKDAAKAAIDADINQYAITWGAQGFREAIAAKFERTYGTVVDPDRRAPRDHEAEATVVRYVEQWFPGLDPKPVHVAECLYTTTPDESFVIERRGPLVIGSPCSGHGFKFTPLVGRRLADLASPS